MIFFKRQEDRQNGEYETKKKSRGQIEKTFRPGASSVVERRKKLMFMPSVHKSTAGAKGDLEMVHNQNQQRLFERFHQDCPSLFQKKKKNFEHSHANDYSTGYTCYQNW